jgi:hypothetical protein
MALRMTFDLPDPAATDRLAEALASALGPGDTVLLEGPIGAGKSHLSRALIRSRLGNPDEDVPSPSFTLVQTYPADPPIWHADLYRLSHPDEVLELGLDEAFGGAICLVEWPDRLGAAAPKDAIRLRLSLHGEGRRAQIDLPDRPRLIAALRTLAGEDFLRRTGWQGAERQALAGDASARRFLRLRRGAETAVLLDNPPGLPDRVPEFVAIARLLRGLGLSAPEILSVEPEAGFVLMEDLGDVLMSHRLARAPEEERTLYALATDVLAVLQAGPVPAGLPDLTLADWAEAAMLCLSFYTRGATGQSPDPAPLRAALTEALARLGDGPKVLIHRDYFAGNILLLNRPGVRAAGLLDFQLAQSGQRVYDLVSLLQDARRDLGPGIEEAMKARFAAAVGAAEGFEAAYAVWGVQRALRILGIFARLCLVEGRSGYLRHLPRVRAQLDRNLAHPGLAGLKRLCDRLIPAADAAALARLEAQCGHFR